jgi:hypothetical protein
MQGMSISIHKPEPEAVQFPVVDTRCCILCITLNCSLRDNCVALFLTSRTASLLSERHMTSTENPSVESARSNTKDNTIAMLVMGGMVLSAAGFAFYTKRTESMLRHLDRIAESQARRAPLRKPGPMTKEEWDKVRPRIDKDEFF